MRLMVMRMVGAFFCLAAACSVQAFDRRIGSRPMGMGDAFLALADDINSLNYNVAGLALEKSLEFSLEYADLYYGLDDGRIQENHLAYSQSLRNYGGWGMAWNNRSVLGVYSENEMILGYGFQPDKNLPFWTGLAVKLFYLGYNEAFSTMSVNSYFSNGNSKYQWGLDLGLLYEITPEQSDFPNIKTGLTMMNLNQPDLGIQNEAKLPLDIRLGGSAQYQEWDGALDLGLLGNQFQIHAGLEKWFTQQTWAVRTGIISGQGTGFTLTVGGTYAFDLASMKLRLNYAFNYAWGGIQDTIGIHRLSLDFLYPALVNKKEISSAKNPEKVEQIRNYLLNKIEEYLVLANKLKDLKQTNQTQPAMADALLPIENLLHEAVGQLVLYQDVMGFLKKYEQAEKQFELISKPAGSNESSSPQ